MPGPLQYKSSKNEESNQAHFSNSAQLEINDDKLSTADTTDTEHESGTWFWNENANEISSDSEEGGHSDVDESNTELEQSRTESAASPEICPVEIKWNRKGENNLRGGYGKGLRSSLKRQKKSAKELEVEALKTYNIEAIWQRHRDLSINSEAISPVRLAETSESQPSEVGNSVFLLSEIPRGSASFLSKQEI